MIYLHEVQLDLSSKIEDVLTGLDQTYSIGLIRAPVLVSTLPEERVTPSTFLKVEDTSDQSIEAFFRCSGRLLLDLSVESGEEVTTSLIRNLSSELQKLLNQRNITAHTYYTGDVKRVSRSSLKEENVNTITFEFEVQGIERPI